MQALNVTPGVPQTKGPQTVRQFAEAVPYFEERNYVLAGVTRDSTGAALGNCTVKLFNAATDALEQQTTSDASGNYSFVVDKTKLWRVVCDGPGVSGTSLPTLAGT